MIENRNISTEIHKLKEFYTTSANYLELLKQHDERYFHSYIKICEEHIPAGSTVLECGCGIGLSTYLLSRLDFKITGMDISPLFISEATRLYGNEGNLHFVTADANNLSFPEQSFDAICSYGFLEHVYNVKTTLKEMHRVLKTNGILLILMPNLLEPTQYLRKCIRWNIQAEYKPWEATSRPNACRRFIKTTCLALMKFININKKIYYLRPILSDNDACCGADYDATWLANAFDVENILKQLGFYIQRYTPDVIQSRVILTMQFFRLPQKFLDLYMKIRLHCVIIAIKQ